MGFHSQWFYFEFETALITVATTINNNNTVAPFAFMSAFLPYVFIQTFLWQRLTWFFLSKI